MPLKRFQFPLGIIVIVAAVLVAIAWSITSTPEIMAMERVHKRAAAAAANGNVRMALSLYEEILAHDPKNHDAYLGKMLLLFRTKDAKFHQKAVEMLRVGWLSDDERIQADPFLTPEDRILLAGPDRYGDIENQPVAVVPGDKTDEVAVDSFTQGGGAVNRINEKYGAMPEAEPATRP